MILFANCSRRQFLSSLTLIVSLSLSVCVCVCLCVQTGTVPLMKGQEDIARDQLLLSRVVHLPQLPPPPPPHPPASKSRYDGNARKTSPAAAAAAIKAPAGQEGEFPCKKCGRSALRQTSPRASLLLRWRRRRGGVYLCRAAVT